MHDSDQIEAVMGGMPDGHRPTHACGPAATGEQLISPAAAKRSVNSIPPEGLARVTLSFGALLFS